MPMSKDERIKKGLLKTVIGGAGALIPGPAGRVVRGSAEGMADLLYEGGVKFTQDTGIGFAIPDDDNKKCKK